MLGDVEVDVAGLFETERGDVEILHPWLLENLRRAVVDESDGRVLREKP